MSDNETSGEARSEPKTGAQTETANNGKGRRPRGGAMLATLLALLSLAANAYLVWFLFFVHPQVFRGDIPATVSSLQDSVVALKDSTSSARDDINQLQDSQKTLEQALRKTSESLGGRRRDWVLEEAEQLMIIANQRLQLAGDFATAATALDIADQRLRSLTDPQLLPVRKLLVEEIDKLRSTNRVDIAGITFELATMAQSVEQLPLSLNFRSMKSKSAKTTSNATSTKPKTQGFFHQLWTDIRSLITIRRNVQSYTPLLPPKQRYFLRENLRLELLGAQQAALRGDADTYRANLKMATHWIHIYFDNDAQPVKQMQAQIQILETEPLSEKRPDISASLEALRAILQKRAGP